MGLRWKFSNDIRYKLFLCISVFMTSLSAEAVTFSKGTVKIGGKTIVVEVAENPQQHERGLMNRTTLAKDAGMLFIFTNEQTRFFWMKNTLIDLSIAFFDKKGVLINIHEMKSGKGVPDSELPSYASEKPAMYALEMESGWFKKNKIKPGDKMTFLKSN